jgi:hypothetical protein
MKLADIASSKFIVIIVPQTLWTLVCKGRGQILPPDPKPVMNDEEFKTMTAALCSFIAIRQINGGPEKKRKTYLNLLSIF